jgi:[acyl-carrier-protein] S-malonyltransferase
MSSSVRTARKTQSPIAFARIAVSTKAKRSSRKRKNNLMPIFRVVLLFPGQGSAAVGMGRELYEYSAAAKKIMDRAREAVGFDLVDLCFNGPADKLTQTEFQQPCVLAVCLAVYEFLRSEKNFHVAAAVGHSLGEYTALVASGALGLEDAVALTRKRGAYMQRAVPLGEGAMAALLGCDLQRAQNICDAVGEGVWVANLNGGGQVVISGKAKAVEEAGRISRQHGVRRSIPLKVSAPFHCPLMAPAAELLKEDLIGVPFGDFAFPVITNVDGMANEDSNRVRDLLTRQVTQRVLFSDCVLHAAEMSPDAFIECGPDATLTNMTKRITDRAPCFSVSDSVNIRALDLS